MTADDKSPLNASDSGGKNGFNGAKRKILRFLFPSDLTCNVCGREIFDGYFCAECENTLPYNNGTICAHCGRLIFNPEERCFSCNGRETWFNRARSVFVYEPPICHLITSLKYDGKRYLAEVFASLMETVYFSSFFNSEVIVYPPMSEERLKERGYNQAELLAKELSLRIGVPVADNAFKKVKETARQATLDATRRRINLSGSFAIKDKTAIKGKRVLLIDDVMTTGATVETLSHLMIKHGALSIDVLTVASVAKGIEGKIGKSEG